MADLRNWRPFRDTHAIQTCQLQIQFGDTAGDVLFRRVDAAMQGVAAGLGLTERQPLAAPGLAFQVVLQPGMTIVPTDQGHIYINRADDGSIPEQFSLGRDILKYEQFIYTRWAPFLDRANRLMKDAVGQYASFSSLASVTSAYIDTFEFGGAGEPDIGEVIDSGSPFVAASSFHQKTLWHTHSGFFEYPDAETRRLVVVNVDIQHGNVSGRPHKVQITTQVTDQFSQSESEPLDPAQVDWNFVSSRAVQQHARLKSLLAQVLTTNAAQAISLIAHA